MDKQHREQYQDSIDIIGRVLMARVNRPRMAIELDDGREVESVFPIEEEKKILAALSEHAQTKVRVLGRGVFDASGTVQKITSIERVDLLSTGTIEYVESAKPIWEEFEEIVSSIPSDDLRKLPKDAAEHHDYYLYGGPKEDK
jgi:hypothetical protein